MSRSLVAGTELYLYLRCEVRSLINRNIRSTHLRPLKYRTAITRAFSSEKGPVIQTTDLQDGSDTTQALPSNQYSSQQLVHDFSKQHAEDKENYKIHEKLEHPAYRHADVASDRVELGLERLGEPATIRVLPERQYGGKNKNIRLTTSKRESIIKQITRAEESGQPSYNSIEQVLDSKSRQANIAEAMNNIETLRRSFFKNIDHLEGPRQKDCYTLARLLQRGFRTTQLLTYWELALPMSRSKADSLDLMLYTKRYRVSRWLAGPSEWPMGSLKRLHWRPNHEEKPYYPILSGKVVNGVATPSLRQTIINNILSVCWGLRPEEEKLQEGSVSLRIESHWLALILQQAEPVFQQVSKLFNVKTEISEEHRLVRVSGNYYACVDAVRMIVNSIDDIQVERVAFMEEDLLGVPRTGMQEILLHSIAGNDRFWQQIEQYTSTKIVPVRPSITERYAEVDVCYLPTDTKGLVSAKRRISQVQKMLQQKFIYYLCIPNVPDKSTSLVPLPEPTDMALMDQNFDWYRWRSWLPAVQNFNQEGDSRATTDPMASALFHAGDGESAKIAEKLFSFWNKLSVQASKTLSSKQFAPRYWDIQPQTSVIANLGQLVHAIPDSTINELQKMPARTSKVGAGRASNITTRMVRKIFQHRRIMTAGIPSLANSLRSLISDASTISNFFKIVLSPSSVNGNSHINISSIPSLEIEVIIDESTKTTSLHRASLILDRRCVDLALPRSVSDVRFSAETMMLSQEATIDPAIIDFIKGCNLDIWGTDQFDTPSSLILVLPEEICQLLDCWPGCDPVEKPKSIANPQADTMQDLHVDRSSESADHQRYATTDKISQDMTHTKTPLPSEAGSGLATKTRQVDVEYVFESLSIHSKLCSHYQGFPLAFSTIEGGQIGGKQQTLEISSPSIADAILQPKARNDESLNAAKASFMAFYGSLSELINRLPK